MIKEADSLPSFQKLEEIHPFVLRKTRSQCKKFTLEQLKKFYHKIFKIDFSIKKGKITPEEGLELLVLDL